MTKVSDLKRTIYFFLALLLVTLIGLIFYPIVRYAWGENEIKTIVQKTSSQDVLKCSYLAELLGLSSQKKTYLYRFNTKEAEDTLHQKAAQIKEVQIEKIKPHSLFVEYSLRQPIAYVADFANTAIDEEGILFPFAPFYTPKYLPEIYFGESLNPVWGTKMGEKKMKLAKEIFSIFPPHAVLWVDLSKSFSSHLGEKEIVVELKNHLLRLSPTEYKSEIANYLVLNRAYLKEKKENCIIDLRLPDVAFVTNVAETDD